MISLAWVGILLVSVSWLYFLPVYTSPTWHWCPLLVTGVTFNWLAFKKLDATRLNFRVFVWLVPFVVASFFLARLS